MEKEPQPDSLSTVTVKEYPNSEIHYAASEAPPAYHRPRQSTAVQVARIAALTVVVVSIILGAFILASAYVQATASCAQLQQELMLLQETSDRLQPEALVQEEQVAEQSKINQNQQAPEKPEESTTPKKMNENESDDNSLDSDSDSDESDDEDTTPIQIKLPLQLDFDDLAEALVAKNQRSRMNCIVEKKRADEVIDHQSKTLRLPFGLNLTTDPRYEHVTGEKMVIFCESGNEQRHVQPEPEEVMMHIQPVIVPIPNPIHHTFQPNPMHQMPVPQRPQVPMHPPQQKPQFLPPHIIAQQIAQAQRVANEAQMAREIVHRMHMEQMQAQSQNQIRPEIPHPLPPQPIHHQQIQIVPRPHIVQQPPMAHQPQVQKMPVPEATIIGQNQRLPFPEELLTEINRLPHEDIIAVQVTEEDDDDGSETDERNMQQRHEIQQPRVIQEPRQNAHVMNGRQTYTRDLPVNIPVPMMQPVEQIHAEQPRPHYVQPRSIRSVDNLLHREKRIKRRTCECTC